MELWVINTYWNSMDGTGGDVTLYDTEELARKDFDKAINEELASYGITDINNTDSGFVVERTEDYFTIYRNGEYILNNSTIELLLLPVNTR